MVMKTARELSKIFMMKTEVNEKNIDEIIVQAHTEYYDMLGVELDGPTKMFGDNNSVISNTLIPSFQLKEKHNVIAYHHVWEAIAAAIINFCHIPSVTNFSDILT